MIDASTYLIHIARQQVDPGIASPLCEKDNFISGLPVPFELALYNHSSREGPHC